MNTEQLIDLGSKTLQEYEIRSHRLDSELILSSILNISREKLLTNKYGVSSKNFDKFKTLITRK